MARFRSRNGYMNNVNPNYFWGLFESYTGAKQQRGNITLGYGLSQEVFIQTSNIPDRVYTQCCDNGVPICAGTQSTATAVNIDHRTRGFILFADVRCDSCTIQWLSEKDQAVEGN